MLSIGKMVAGAEDYYLGIVAQGKEEYYTGTGEAPGKWMGSGTEALSLRGEVVPDDLRAILAGDEYFDDSYQPVPVLVDAERSSLPPASSGD